MLKSRYDELVKEFDVTEAVIRSLDPDNNIEYQKYEALLFRLEAIYFELVTDLNKKPKLTLVKE